MRQPLQRLCGFLAIAVVLLGCVATTTRAEDESNNPDRESSKTEKAESREKNNSRRYTFRKIHDPNGIGKFYLGREIAHVMGYGPRGSGAAWLDRQSREQEENLTLLIKSLKLKPGMVVADIGAGSGRISFLMAEQVLPEGKVMAVDVQQEMLNLIRKKAKQRDVTNIELVKGGSKTPRLKRGTVDLAIMVDVYHEFEYPYEMMVQLAAALKPGGRIAFVEYRKEDPTVPIKLVHKMTEAQVKKEISQPEFGLKWKETIGVLPRQHIVVFERMAVAEAGSERATEKSGDD